MKGTVVHFGGFELRPDTASLKGNWSAYAGGFHVYGLGGVPLGNLIAAIASA